MKYLKWIFIITFIFSFSFNTAQADDIIATQTFTTQANDTIEVLTSGNISTAISGMTGNLNNALNVSFSITSNIAIKNLRIRALVETYNAGKVGGFKSSESGATSSGNLPLTLVLGNTATNYLPCSCCVHDAMGIPTPCLATGLCNNANSLAYTGTINIDNGGTLSYVDDNVESYFMAQVNTNTTNINLKLGTAVVPNSYNSTECWDITGTYSATVFLDNIPE